MERYFVEGIVITKQGLKKAQKRGSYAASDLEPFARSFWANNPEEALRQANEALNGGQWQEPPRISRISEEQRMRAIGAPELPGFGAPEKKKKPRA